MGYKQFEGSSRQTQAVVALIEGSSRQKQAVVGLNVGPADRTIH